MQAEFERLEDLEDSTDILKSELEKKDEIIDEMTEYMCKKELFIDKYLNVVGKGYIKQYFENKVNSSKQ